jgi:hypothetical protein
MMSAMGNGDDTADGERTAARFEQRWLDRRDERRAHPNPLARFGRLALGILVLLLAIPIGAIPGPGGVAVTLAGFYLLAGEVRWIARMLDWGERVGSPHGRRAMDWWMRSDVRVVRVVLALVVVIPVTIWLARSGAVVLFVIWGGALALLLLIDVVVLATQASHRRLRGNDD